MVRLCTLTLGCACFHPVPRACFLLGPLPWQTGLGAGGQGGLTLTRRRKAASCGELLEGRPGLGLCLPLWPARALCGPSCPCCEKQEAKVKLLPDWPLAPLARSLHRLLNREQGHSRMEPS